MYRMIMYFCNANELLEVIFCMHTVFETVVASVNFYYLLQYIIS